MKKLVFIMACFSLVSCGGGYSNTRGSGTSPISTVAIEVDCTTVLPNQIVTIQTGSFFPASQSITQNEVVEWMNNDSLSHSVTAGSSSSPTGAFDLLIIPGASRCLRFVTIGTFPYFSRTNPAIVGKIIVI